MTVLYIPFVVVPGQDFPHLPVACHTSEAAAMIGREHAKDTGGVCNSMVCIVLADTVSEWVERGGSPYRVPSTPHGGAREEGDGA